MDSGVDIQCRRGRLGASEIATIKGVLREAPTVRRSHAQPGGRASRFALEFQQVDCRAEHPGGGTSESVAYLCEVSETGMVLIYTGYLHERTGICTDVPARTGGTVQICGTVSACRHLYGQIHEIEVRSNEPVPVQELVPHAEWAKVDNARQVDKPLNGQVAVCSECSLTRNAVVFCLADTALRLSPTSRPGELLDQIKSEPFDVVVLDLDEGDFPALDVVQGIRRAHFSGPILLLSEDQEAGQIASMDPGGNATLLSKPLDKQSVLAVIREALRSSNATRQEEPIFSTAESRGGAQMLHGFIGEARGLINSLVTQASSMDAEPARRMLLKINNTGGSYGFAPISEAADRVLQELGGGRTLRECLPSLRRLEEIAMRLSVRGE